MESHVASTQFPYLQGETGKMTYCIECRRNLTFDEMGMNRKMVSLDVKEMRCLTCLARKYNIGEDVLREKIEYLRRSGCTLFSPMTDKKGSI